MPSRACAAASLVSSISRASASRNRSTSRTSATWAGSLLSGSGIAASAGGDGTRRKRRRNDRGAAARDEVAPLVAAQRAQRRRGRVELRRDRGVLGVVAQFGQEPVGPALQ